MDVWPPLAADPDTVAANAAREFVSEWSEHRLQLELEENEAEYDGPGPATTAP